MGEHFGQEQKIFHPVLSNPSPQGVNSPRASREKRLGKSSPPSPLLSQDISPNKSPLTAPSDSNRTPIFVEKNQLKSNSSFALIPLRAIIAEGGDE